MSGIQPLSAFANLKIRYKMLISYSVAFLLTVSLGSFIIYTTAKRSIEARLESELNTTTTAILNMIRTTASVSIKNHLQTIVLKNHEIVQRLYERHLQGELEESDARQMARDILLSQTIGSTGYIYCLSSIGEMVVHPKDELIGTNLSDYEFARTLKKQRTGYLEYNWQNPDETKARPKAIYTTYFEPWDWIIAASSYRREFHNLINLDDFRESIHSLRFGESGYAQIYDTANNQMIQPVTPKRFFDPASSAYTDLIRNITRKKNGKQVFKVDSGDNGFTKKIIVFFNEIPEFQWVVLCLSDYQEVYASLITIRRAMFLLIGISLLLFLPVTFWISASITRPLYHLMQHLTAGTQGDVSGRMQICTHDEMGQLSQFFNTFMARLETSAHDLKLEMQEREKAEEAIRDSEKKYRELVENANSIILRIDPQGRIKFINRYALTYFDYSPERIIGRPVVGTIVPQETTLEDQLVPPFQITPQNVSFTSNLILENQRRSGEQVWVSWTRRAVKDKKGQLLEYLCIGNDMTARIKMEEMMIQTEKMMSIGGLAAGMAHEINNPLGVMVQNTQNIIRRLSKELPKNEMVAKHCHIDLEHMATYLKERRIDRLLEDVRQSGARAADIVTRMLNFSRRDDTRLKPTCLEELIERTLALAAHDFDLKKKYDFRNINIEQVFEANLPEVFCDSAEIQQVLLNLIKNSAQALQQKKETEADLEAQIVIRLMKVAQQIRIEVSDNGPGMDEATRKRIFEPFYTTKAIGDGTGLGLSVSYFIIKSHHKGEMTVDSTPGKGATFTIDLPLNIDL